MVQRDQMPAFEVQTAQRTYQAWWSAASCKRVQRVHSSAMRARSFIVTTRRCLGAARAQRWTQACRTTRVLFFPGGEPNKRLSLGGRHWPSRWCDAGADRTSIVIGFGGGIVTDVGGFLAAIFMRGIPVLQIPTTLLAQVDAAIGGKTGVNLRERQEPDRQLSSAAGGADRSRRARDAAGARVPRRTLRSDQVRRSFAIAQLFELHVRSTDAKSWQ